MSIPTCKGRISIIQAGAPAKHEIYFAFFTRELTSNVVKTSLRAFNQAHLSYEAMQYYLSFSSFC